MNPDPGWEPLERVVRARLADAEPAHDWLHVQRVVANARAIAAAEGADAGVVLTAALLHELVNLPKGHPDSARSGELCADAAAELLRAHGHAADRIAAVCACIRVHGFSRGLPAETLEARVLQDADRLDAIGAIGVARCFASCADMKRPFYHPDDPFCAARPPDDKQWGLDHFYRKLLRIHEGLHTPTARALGQSRAAFLHAFLAQLEGELRGA